MKTVYCIDCLRVIRQFFVEMQRVEDLLASVCEPCRKAFKAEMDLERQSLYREGRVNPLVNKARAILHAQGVRA